MIVSYKFYRNVDLDVTPLRHIFVCFLLLTSKSQLFSAEHPNFITDLLSGFNDACWTLDNNGGNSFKAVVNPPRQVQDFRLHSSHIKDRCQWPDQLGFFIFFVYVLRFSDSSAMTSCGSGSLDNAGLVSAGPRRKKNARSEIDQNLTPR